MLGVGVELGAGDDPVLELLRADHGKGRPRAAFLITPHEQHRFLAILAEFGADEALGFRQLLLDDGAQLVVALQGDTSGHFHHGFRAKDGELAFDIAGVPRGGVAPERDGARIGGEEEHRFGCEVAAGGAGGRSEFVVGVHDNGGGAREACDLGPGGALSGAEIPLVNILAEGLAGDGFAAGVEHAEALEFAEDGVDAAGAMHVLDVVIRGGRDFAQARDTARNLVNPLDVVGQSGFARDGQRVEDRVRGAAHRDVQHDGIVEGFERGDVARLEVMLDELEDGARGAVVEGFAFLGDREDGAVAG